MATSSKARKVVKTAPDPYKPNPWFAVRNSRVHGKGCFARRFIPKGTRVSEYVGDRVTWKEADARYEGYDVNDNHTFLFIVDRKTVIDGGVGGNEARFINHSCAENCESTVEKGRVYIDAVKDIKKGDELGYDYQIGRDKNDPQNVDEIYACRCGASNCRGTMLWPAKRPKVAGKAKKKAAGKKVAKKKSAKKKAAKKTARKTAKKAVKQAAKRAKKKSRR
jgi:hypothetical protein